MNNKIIRAAIFALLFGSHMAFAASAKVTISSPPDGVTVDSKDTIKLGYEAVPGADGEHLHLNVDGKRVEVISQLKGVAEVAQLAPGKHRICLALNSKGHVPTGVEGCVNVNVK